MVSYIKVNNLKLNNRPHIKQYHNLKIVVSISSDPAMKQLLLHLDETQALGRRFIIQDLDETHVFVSSDIVDVLQGKIDDLMDQASVSLQDKQT